MKYLNEFTPDNFAFFLWIGDTGQVFHKLPTGINVDHFWDRNTSTAWLKVEVSVEARTGVEMEAMAGVCGGLLVLYDMLKAAGQDMALGPVRLLLKEGGRRGTVTGSIPGCPWPK